MTGIQDLVSDLSVCGKSEFIFKDAPSHKTSILSFEPNYEKSEVISEFHVDRKPILLPLLIIIASR